MAQPVLGMAIDQPTTRISHFRCFVDDLLIDPATRNVSDVSHKVCLLHTELRSVGFRADSCFWCRAVQVVAVGSRSIERAQEFIDSYEPLKAQAQPARAYGSYEELVKDKDVDIVYIGTSLLPSRPSFPI